MQDSFKATNPNEVSVRRDHIRSNPFITRIEAPEDWVTCLTPSSCSKAAAELNRFFFYRLLLTHISKNTWKLSIREDSVQMISIKQALHHWPVSNRYFSLIVVFENKSYRFQDLRKHGPGLLFTFINVKAVASHCGAVQPKGRVSAAHWPGEHLLMHLSSPVEWEWVQGAADLTICLEWPASDSSWRAPAPGSRGAGWGIC